MIAAFYPYSETTGAVTVRVSVRYSPEQSHPDMARWFWTYHIRIENGGDVPVQLINRFWRIVDGHGGVHHVEGAGVVGEQPVIAPGGAFDYVSGCPLPTPEGHMVGSYEMQIGGDSMMVAIPQFPLVAPETTP